jgi:hypothetical protein
LKGHGFNRATIPTHPFLKINPRGEAANEMYGLPPRKGDVNLLP